MLLSREAFLLHSKKEQIQKQMRKLIYNLRKLKSNLGK